MYRCHECSRHVWGDDRACPFCAAPLTVVVSAAPALISALVGLAMFGCTSDDMSGETNSGSASESMSATSPTSTGTTMASMSSTSDVTMTVGTGSTSSASSTSATATTSDETDPGSTSITSSTSSTGSTGSTGSTSTTDTTAGSDSEGECMGPGEEMCAGECVNTDQDSQHCGMCLNVCDDEQSEMCVEGECVVIVPPYGAPMPEALWV